MVALHVLCVRCMNVTRIYIHLHMGVNFGILNLKILKLQAVPVRAKGRVWPLNF